jgi:hypothetical protein
MNYYRLLDDMYFPNRWHLGEIYGIDNWMFKLRMKDVPLETRHTIQLEPNGAEKDYTSAAPYDVSVVSHTIKSLLQDISDVAFMPLDIDGKVTAKSYYALVVYPHLDCVDEQKSDFKKFLPNDPVRPDRAGDYSSFYNLVIDANKVAGYDVFRIARSRVQIIISQKIKDRFDAAGITGVIYQPVTE